MNFSERLNAYLAELDCTARELAEVSGLSASVISRYRSGERIPESGSIKLKQLVSGIAEIAVQKNVPDLEEAVIERAFLEILGAMPYDYQRLASNFNSLISVMEINITELSRFLNFDASYLSRIRSGQRKPADPDAFVNQVSRFVVRRYQGNEERAVLAELVSSASVDLTSDSACLGLLTNWLGHGQSEGYKYIEDFLKKLDDFNLDEYICAIHFNDMKVPNVPFSLTSAKSYYGIEEMKQGELDFFKATVLSKSMEPIFMCSDMPMEDMAKDLEFGKKWMFAIAMSLKKGLHLNIIHNVNRPLREMMLGLESWIPIYMTGQVSPFYLKGIQTSVYCHFNYVSGAVALSGECIEGHHANGKYHLSKDKADVGYYRQKAADLLSKAQPLMDIYRKSTENEFWAFQKANALIEGARHHIYSSLPFYTMTRELLSGIIKRHSLSQSDSEVLFEELDRQQNRIATILQHSPILDEVNELSEEAFSAKPALLSLSSSFYEKELSYTYEEYREHYHLTEEYAASHENYSMKVNHGPAFRNIQISIHEKKLVILSKNKAPVIHFVIRHSKMVHAFEHFTVPIYEPLPK